MAAYCYMLECEGGSFYTGWAKNPVKRFRVHQAGKGAAYTRLHKALKLVYIEEVEDRSTALRREYAIKQLSHAEKLGLINSAGNRLNAFEKVPETDRKSR